MERDGDEPTPAVIEVLWIPLGAGQHVVRLSGRVFEALAATVGRRPRCDLYHSALVVELAGERTVVEMTPVVDRGGSGRGVAVTGAVGSSVLGRLRIFRYEVRRWPGGVIPDAAAAAVTHRVEVDRAVADRLLELVPAVPPFVWGRDRSRAGEMWNSNSVTSWLLVTSGVDVTAVGPPAGGRGPGWDAGITVARRAGDQPSGVQPLG